MAVKPVCLPVGPALAGAALTACLAAAAGEPLELSYASPATEQQGSSHALPLGNGRLGCLVFGDPYRERLALNVDSLWTGDANPSGAYDTMGAYQAFGDLRIELEAPEATRAEVVAASDHKPFYGTEGVPSSVDGDLATKWCVEPRGSPVMWEARLPQACAVAAYTLTSTPEDRPDRDPKAWELAGSDDGAAWTPLDRRENQPAFARRGAARTFAVAAPRAFRRYRLTLLANQGGSHLQLAEIGLTGVDLIRALKAVAVTEKIPCAVLTSQELDSADFNRLPTGAPVLRAGNNFADDFAKVVTQLGLG